MCGIAGVFARAGRRSIPPQLLRRLAARLRHRGPEAEGFFRAPGVGLAHTRLAIIDLTGGRQPMGNEDGTIQVVCNGEVFNYLELREELEARGHRFRTRSDTEVLVHLYEEDGPAFARRLNGQFALALYDASRELLLLVRDAVGILPLYHVTLGEELLFASEVDAFRAHPEFRAAPDPAGLAQLFTLWAPIPPRTVWAGVAELPPGHLLLATPRRVLTRRWAPPPPPLRETEPDEAAARLRATLGQAVRLRLRADVPVGAYVSGGLDSAVTATLAAAQVGPRLHTFGVAFTDRRYDESPFQELLARHLGTRHHTLRITPADIQAAFPGVVRRAATPLLRTAPVPLFLLSRYVRSQGLKVVLTGEGADEAFLGYNIFRETKVRRFWARAPHSRRRARLLHRLYPYLQSRPGGFWEAFFRPDLTPVADPFYSHRPRWRHGPFFLSFFTGGMRHRMRHALEEELLAYLPELFRLEDPVARAALLERRLFLPGYLLAAQGDRMLMAHAVEGRYPFLDPEVLALAEGLPTRCKLPGLREKALLKRAFADRLPPPIRRRPKQPYRAPGVTALLADGREPEYVTRALDPATLRRVGLFAPAPVTRLAAKVTEQVRRGRPVAPREEMAFLGVLSAQLLYDAEEPAGDTAPPAPAAVTKEGRG